MEWKWDEKWMFQHAEYWSHSGTWPQIGVLSGAGIQNTGFSTWPFIAMAKMDFSPLQMVASIGILNILSLIIFYFALLKFKPEWKTAIQWGLLIAMTHVLGFVFSRKIWAQDLLPFFTSLGFWGWVNRDKVWPIVVSAFGFAFAVQLHISGLYLLASFGMASIYFDFRNKKTLRNWLGIFTLSFALFFTPSIHWLVETFSKPTDTVSRFGYWYKFEYYLRILTDTLGINVHYSLGKSILDFVKFPSGTYLICVPILTVVCIWLYSLVKGIPILIKNKLTKESRFLLLTYVILPSIFYTVSSIPVRNHYLIIVFPMMQVLVGILLLKIQPKLLPWLCTSQLIISILFLSFVHKNKTINGDYGTPFSKQSFTEQTETVSERPPGK